MNKIIKLLSLIILISAITGCNSNALDKAYNKMQVKEKGINGYALDLRIYGVAGDTKINETIKIYNYMNKDFKIVKTGLDKNKKRFEVTSYLFADTVYLKNTDGEYAVSNEKIKYTNPDLYIIGVKSAKILEKNKSEIIGENKYDSYKVTFDQKVVKDMLKDTNVTNVTVPSKVEGEVLLDKDGYLYRVKYIVSEITINANYFGIGTASKINLPR